MDECEILKDGGGDVRRGVRAAPSIALNIGMHDLTFVGDAEAAFAGKHNPNPTLASSPKAGTFDRLLRAIDRAGFGPRRLWMAGSHTRPRFSSTHRIPQKVLTLSREVDECFAPDE